MIPQSDYSINYSPAGGPDGNIVIPGTSPDNANTNNSQPEEGEGVVITPDPSGIVIKTRLTKQTHFSFGDDGQSNDSYVPPSLSSIYANSQNSSVNVSDSADTHNNNKEETKVFLNICTHPLISVPGQRKGLDEQTGKEIDGWRLPMSVGELRPCYDKMGNAAIVADCILNPRVVREMNSDSNHFHFVCDLVVQCASRKFGRTWFGGLELDRRFKLPKMKYAGYVDEATGLPIGMPNEQNDGMTVQQKAVVAKQRVKGHGGKSLMIEEVESCPSSADARSGQEGTASLTADDDAKASRVNSGAGFRIELFICNNGDSDNHERMPLLIS